MPKLNKKKQTLIVLAAILLWGILGSSLDATQSILTPVQSNSKDIPDGWYGYEIEIYSKFLKREQFVFILGQQKPNTKHKQMIPAIVFSGWGELTRGQRIGAYGYLHDYHLGKQLPTEPNNILYIFPGPPRYFIGSESDSATAYEKYILIELKREIAKLWAVDDEKWRVDGISWGGLHSLTLGLRFPDEFNCIYAQQPAVKKHYKVLARAVEASTQNLSGRCVRMITATHDFYLSPTKKLNRALLKVGADSKLKIYPGYHDKKFVRTYGVRQLLNYHKD